MKRAVAVESYDTCSDMEFTMRPLLSLIASAGAALVATTVLAESELLRQFARDYATLHQDLLNHKGEVVEVRDFVYTKDIATFTFSEGELHFQRYVNSRPTTVIFIGKGHAKIDVPSHVERQSLLTLTGDSTIEAEFNTCFIRMADDFDLLVKKKYLARSEQMDWGDFNRGSKKQAQGELFFKPVVFHPYDNYFQLLRSAYERREDGYFWLKFNRYTFNFDPNRPEGVRVAYQLEEGDIVPVDAVVMQRKERGIYEDSAMSRITYATSVLSKYGRFEMGGADGHKILNGEGHVKLVVTADSLRFLSLFLDQMLGLDSIRCNGRTFDYWRRRDFWFIGAILPDYVHRQESLDVALFYHGADYATAFPGAEDPRTVPHSLTLVSPQGVNYFFADSASIEYAGEGRQEVRVSSAQPYSRYIFSSLRTGYDTVRASADNGLELNFLRMKRTLNHVFEMNKRYTIDCFNALCDFLGAPAGRTSLAISYNTVEQDMPGTITSPLGSSDDYFGGWHHAFGQAVARQWFSRATAGLTERESWLPYALSEYAALMAVQKLVGADAFYRNLVGRWNVLDKSSDRGRDMPLAAGSAAATGLRVTKGIWLVHMLRWLMYDLDKQSDENFTSFLREVAAELRRPGFTNHDFQLLAEKHYGGSLEQFFQYWVYGTGTPEYDVDYSIEQRGSEYFINVEVTDKCRQTLRGTPVMVRVVLPERTEFGRALIDGPRDTLRIGPYQSRPTEFHFNEFMSVLSKDNVHRK